MGIQEWEGYGVTKVALAILCTALAGAFTFLILYPLLDIVSETCSSVAPFLGCQHITDMVSWVFGPLTAVLWPFVGMPWLVRQSYLVLSFIIVGLIGLMCGGYFILKNRYNGLTHVEPTI